MVEAHFGETQISDWTIHLVELKNPAGDTRGYSLWVTKGPIYWDVLESTKDLGLVDKAYTDTLNTIQEIRAVPENFRVKVAVRGNRLRYAKTKIPVVAPQQARLPRMK
jgi:hypothetical protein